MDLTINLDERKKNGKPKMIVTGEKTAKIPGKVELFIIENGVEYKLGAIQLLSVKTVRVKEPQLSWG